MCIHLIRTLWSSSTVHFILFYFWLQRFNLIKLKPFATFLPLPPHWASFFSPHKAFYWRFCIQITFNILQSQFFFKPILSPAAENNHPSGTNERQADNALIYIQSMWNSLYTIKPKRWMLMQLFGATEVKIHISRTWFAPNKKKNPHPFSSETEKNTIQKRISLIFK